MVAPRKPDAERTIWDSSEACWAIGVSYKTLVDLVINRGLPAKNIGTEKKARYLFLKAEVENWMTSDRLAIKKRLSGMNKGLTHDPQ